MPAEPATLTHCPTCGAKLHRTDLSLCAYCASPLHALGSVAPPSDEVVRKLGKVTSHADYSAALAWTPVEPATDRRSRRLQALGGAFLFAAGLGLILQARRGVASVTGGALFVIGLALIVAGRRVRSRANAAPMLRRAALVIDRRSQTELSGRTSATTYFFKLAFGDGSEGEFRFPGRGVMYEPPAVGATGIAYTRGAALVEFKRL